MAADLAVGPDPGPSSTWANDQTRVGDRPRRSHTERRAARPTVPGHPRGYRHQVTAAPAVLRARGTSQNGDGGGEHGAMAVLRTRRGGGWCTPGPGGTRGCDRRCGGSGRWHRRPSRTGTPASSGCRARRCARAAGRAPGSRSDADRRDMEAVPPCRMAQIDRLVPANAVSSQSEHVGNDPGASGNLRTAAGPDSVASRQLAICPSSRHGQCLSGSSDTSGSGIVR